MAVRLTCRYKSNMAVRYGIEIHDTELLVDSSDTFICALPGAQSFYNNNEIDVFNPIVASECSFSMKIENANHELFFTDYIGSPEGRFLVRLFYMDGAIETTYHIGKVTHDRAVLQQKKNPILSINTVDPLMELAHIDYVTFSGDEFIPGTTQVLDWEFQSYNDIIIKFLLRRSATINYFFPNDTDPLIEVLNEYIAVEHNDPNDVISDTYILNYFRENSNGQLTRKKCIYVLAEIMKSLGSRIYYDKDRFFIEQLGAKTEEVTTSTVYQKDGTMLGTLNSSFDIDYQTSPIHAGLYPEFTFLSPINSVVLEQNGNYKENLLYDISFDASTPADPVVVGKVSDLDQNLRTYCRINIRGWSEKVDVNGDLVDYDDEWAHYYYIKIALTIQIGGHYLSGNGVLGADSESNILNIPFTTWSTNTSNKVTAIVPVRYMYADFQQNANDQAIIIDLVSPNIVSVGDITFGISNFGLTEAERSFYRHVGKVEPPTPLNHFLTGDSNSLAVLKNVDDAEDEKGSVLTTLINNLKNTVIYNTRYDMGSFPGTTSKHRVKVFNGTELVDSNEWTHPDYGNMPYQQLAIHDVKSLRTTAKYRLHQVVRMLGEKPFSMRSRLLYEGKVLVPMHFALISQTDVTESLWVEITKDTAVTPPIDIEYPTGETGLAGGNGITMSLQGQNPDTAASGYYKYIDSISGDNIILDDYEEFPNVAAYTERSIQASWRVYLGAAKQRYRDLPKAQLSTGEYRIDVDNKKVEWSRDHTGKVAEIYIDPRYVDVGVII